LGDGHHLHPNGARGFVYLAVVLDWFSRRVLSWRLDDGHFAFTIEMPSWAMQFENVVATHTAS
jgi:transposase InsO family protein